MKFDKRYQKEELLGTSDYDCVGKNSRAKENIRKVVSFPCGMIHKLENYILSSMTYRYKHHHGEIKYDLQLMWLHHKA